MPPCACTTIQELKSGDSVQQTIFIVSVWVGGVAYGLRNLSNLWHTLNTLDQSGYDVLLQHACFGHEHYTALSLQNKVIPSPFNIIHRTQIKSRGCKWFKTEDENPGVFTMLQCCSNFFRGLTGSQGDKINNKNVRANPSCVHSSAGLCKLCANSATISQFVSVR